MSGPRLPPIPPLEAHPPSDRLLPPCSVLVRVGPRLEALNLLITAGLSGAGDAGAVLAHQTLAYSLCCLYGSCWRMAGSVPFTSAQAQLLGRGTLLVVGAGRIALESTAAALPAGPLRSEQLRDHCYGLLFAMRHELRFAAGQPDGGRAELRRCALLDQVPPEQALSLLAAIAEAVGPGEAVTGGLALLGIVLSCQCIACAVGRADHSVACQLIAGRELSVARQS